MSEWILETRNLKKYYGKQPAVNDVSLKIPRGTLYGLLGPNGAGKSTTLKLLTGLINPSEGQIIAFGEPYQRKHLERIGALIESPAIYENLTAVENLKMSYVENAANWWLKPLIVITLLAPFIYIIIFTLVFSKLFTNNIHQPLQLLMDASQKIKGKDLDFEISYHSQNELGRLCDAFSEMKEELQNSLSAQWKMEQERVEIVESLAHDLKTPLSIILGYSEALIDSYREAWRLSWKTPKKDQNFRT